jgi:hypothetical protein
MTTTALVPTGVLVTCCGDHQPAGCCGWDECAPCCPECPACPTVQARTPAQRRADAAAHRALLFDLIAWRHEIDTPPWGGEAPSWASSSTSSP